MYTFLDNFGREKYSMDLMKKQALLGFESYPGLSFRKAENITASKAIQKAG